VTVTKGLFFLILFPLAAGAQQSPLPPEAVQGSMEGRLDQVNLDRWVVFGRTTDMRGRPLEGVTVRVDLGIGAGSMRTVKTNLRGDFRADFTLDPARSSHLSVHLVGTKSGYHQADETSEIGDSERAIGIPLVLRGLAQDPDQLPVETLVSTLAPRLRQDADHRRKDFVKGCQKLIDRHDAVHAVPLLAGAVRAAPSCVECRLLLTLALLEAGGWTSGSRQLVEAGKLNDAAALKRPEPALIAGVLEAWRGETSIAAGFFQNALTIDPHYALPYQEMGRVLIAQKNWAAADQYLQKAISAGAVDALFLRVRALVEEGDIDEARREIHRYTTLVTVNLSPEARTLDLQLHEHSDLQLREHRDLRSPIEAMSVLDESPRDLMKAMPELKGLRAASDQGELRGILEKVSEGVESFFQSLPDTASVEQVHQDLLDKNGKVASSLDQDFQYLLLTRPDESGVGIEENRATLQGTIAALKGLDKGLMLTEGFASVPLFFHPDYQKGAGFRYLGRQSLEGKDLYVVAFAQKPGVARSTERFRTNEGSTLIFVQGVAWIDPTNFQIVRLRTDLLAPYSAIRLQRQTTVIQFQEVPFKGVGKAFWLPQQVSVTVDWKGRVYRNQHRYSDYKLFKVETKEERKSLSLSAPPGQQKRPDRSGPPQMPAVQKP
jgi:tetratricopeptide (TPR) repeat protein